MKQAYGQEIVNIINQFFGWIILGLVGVVVAAGIILVVWPQYQLLTAARYDRLPQERFIRQEREQQWKYWQAKSQQPALFTNPEQQLLNLVLPGQFDFPSAVIQLTNLVQQHGYLMASLSTASDRESAKVTQTSPVEGVKATVIQAEIIGQNYNDFKRLIMAVETSIMVFDVTAVKYDPNTDIQSLTLVTYNYPLP